jgi:demethylmenaquinone methyltransferase/2-methoxy-6-polyprenyl-1,4-benzoquinol methylase
MVTRSKPLPHGRDKVRSVQTMFDRIAPRYDLVNRIMTFGLDIRWRRRVVTSLSLSPDSLVFDVACGTGDLCREVESQGLQAVGFDFSKGMLVAARTDAPLVQADALALPVKDGSADGVTCGFALRNVVDIRALFNEFRRVLRPGGRLGILEVAEPNARVLKLGHRMYFRHVVPFIGALLSDRDAYRYLPQSTAYLPPRPELLHMLHVAGFVDADSRLVGLGAAQLITGTKT